MQVEIDPLGVQLAEEAQQIEQRAAEPIDRPGGDQIDLTPARSPAAAGASRGRSSRGVPPLTPASSNTAAIVQPCRAATDRSSASWCAVLCSSVEQRR